MHSCSVPVERANAMWRHEALVRLTTSELSRAKRRTVPEYRDAENGGSRPDIRFLGVASGTEIPRAKYQQPVP